MDEDKDLDTEEKVDDTLLTGDDGETDSEDKGSTGEDQKDTDSDKDKADSKADDSSDKKADKETGPPETYDAFKVPDGMELDTEKLEAFSPVAKELGLDQVGAQKLVDFYSNAMQEATNKQQEVWANTISDWREAATKDSEFGGKNFQENLGFAKKALDTFGNEKLREALDQTGMGNHPEVIRMLVNIGEAVSNDTLVFGKGGNEAPKSHADILFPNQTK